MPNSRIINVGDGRYILKHTVRLSTKIANTLGGLSMSLRVVPPNRIGKRKD